MKIKIKYKLTYEWESPSADIESYAEDCNCTIEEAARALIDWNKEDDVDRLNARAANILSNYTSKFEYEVI